MPRTGILPFAVLMAAVGLGSVAGSEPARMAAAGTPIIEAVEATRFADPFPIARVRIASERLKEGLKGFDASTLVRLSRKSFELKVRKAGRAAAERRRVPRLVEARYSASLQSGDLGGVAEWTLLNPRSEPGFFPLEQLKAALHLPIWSDGKPAIAGKFGPGIEPGLAAGIGSEAAPQTGIWVPPGQNILKFQWSAAGTGLAGDRQFQLQFPSCPTAVLDLDLPADQAPSISSQVLLTGPFPATNPKSRTWRLRFGERSRLEFSIHARGNDAGIVVASQVAKYELASGRMTCTFESDLRAPHGSVSEWVFQVSPGLTIVDAVVNDRTGWRVDPTTHELRIALRQSAIAGKVAISATGPLPPRGQRAPLPFVRARQSVGAEERLELRVHPDLELQHLDAADFRLRDSILTPDGARVLTFSGALLASGTAANRRLPTLTVSGAKTEFATQEGLSWRIEGNRVSLGARVGIRVRRGPLFRLSFRIPAGFTLLQATTVPEGLLAYSGKTATGIEMEFSRPLATGQNLDLRLEFRGPTLADRAIRRPIPRLEPVGAVERNGWLSLAPGPRWRCIPWRVPGLVAAGTDNWPEGAPASATAAYAFRGICPAGEMFLIPIRPHFTARVEPLARTGAAPASASAATRLILNVKSGVLNGVTIVESGPASKRAWKVADGSNGIASSTVLAAEDVPLLRSLIPGGLVRRLRFSHQQEKNLVLVTKPGSEPGTFRVLGAGEEIAKEVQQAPLAKPKASSAGQWAFEGLHLITLCTKTHALVVFGGVIQTRGGGKLPIVFPAGAELRAACVGGHWLDPGQCEGSRIEDRPTLELPAPAGEAPVRFEIRYRLPMKRGILGRIESPRPELAGQENSISRWWAFPRGVAAAWPVGFRGPSSVAELPILLGEPLERPYGALAVWEHPSESATVVPSGLARGLGMGLAGLLAALAILGTRYRHLSIGIVLALFIFLTGIAVRLGPAAWELAAFPPLIASLAGLAAVALARGWPSVRTRMPALSSISSSKQTGLTIAAFLVAIPWMAHGAQPSASRDLAFILPGPPDHPENETVIVPKALLDRLDRLQKKPEPGLVIGSANYEGRVADGLARFVARFTVHNFQGLESAIQLPLSNCRLERAALDGKPALPVAIRPNLYSIPVAGLGSHQLEIRFSAPVASSGSEREVRFGVPEVLDSSVSLEAPTAARQLRAVGRQGLQSVAAAKGFVRLEAFLGGIRTVQIRWREGAAGAASVSVREGCVWDVSEAGHSLTACYQVRVNSGSIPSLQFDLPAELEPTRVTVRSLDAAIGQNVLGKWTIGAEAKGRRPLRIDLTGPTDGRLLVILEAAPRGAPTRKPTLRFPRPIAMTRTDAIYGLRANRVAFESIGRSGVIDFAADALLRDYGSVPDLRLSPTDSLLAFSPRSSDSPELRPVIRSGSEPPTISQEAKWIAGYHRANGSGTISFTSKNAIPLLDFALAASVTEVRGAEVASWAQSGGRVQVWFRKPIKEGTVEWAGSFSPNAASKAAKPFACEFPLPGVGGARTGHRAFTIVPEEGWAVRVERDKGWKAVVLAERGRRFESNASQPPPKLQLYPPSPRPARGFGMIEASKDRVIYQARVGIPIAANRPHHLVLRAWGLPTGADRQLDVPPGTLVHEERGPGGSHKWNLDVPASPAKQFHATLSMEFARKEGLTLPTVDFSDGGVAPNAQGVIRLVGLAGKQEGAALEGAVRSKMAAIASAWPGEAERLRRVGGSVWAVADGMPRLVFTAMAEPAAKPIVAPVTAATPEAPAPPPVVPKASRLETVGWGAATLVVAVLFVRFPRASWPEQIGILGAMLGFIVSGGMWLGLAAYVAARSIAAIDWLARSR